MPQHDMIIDNGSGAGVRADLNNALAALASTQKGPNAPPAPAAGMFWLDDDTPSASVWTLKCYDGADWITVGTFDIAGNSFTPSLTARVLAAALGSAGAPAFSFSGDPDTGFFSPAANVFALAIGGAEVWRVNALGNFGFGTASPGAKYDFRGESSFRVEGAGIIQSAIDGLNSINWQIGSDGSAIYVGTQTNHPLRLVANNIERMRIPPSGPVTVDGRALQIQRGTEQATTSGTAIDFTGIPAGVRRITILLDGVSLAAGDTLNLQLGDSGGFEATGYSGLHGIVAGTAAGSISSSLSTAFSLFFSTFAATDTVFGAIELFNQSGNKWAIKSRIGRTGTAQIHDGIGFKTLSDVLDRVRIRSDAASAFDAGTINILWES